MSYAYEQRKRPQESKNTAQEQAGPSGPDFSALISGAAAPTAAQKGRSIDLDGAIRAKMENAFGDLSAVKLYESRAVGDAGAEAVAQGNEIAFAPGMADFSSRSGQERLGHELSHVMSQRSGQVRGRGFLADSSLEAQADREGALAAAGEQVYTGPVTHALSGASPSPSAAGVMQAKRRDEDAKKVKEMQQEGDTQNWNYALAGSEGYDELDPEEWEEKTHTPFFSKLWGKKDQTFKVRKMTPEQKQASEDADNLFAIHRGQEYFDENDNALTTENENAWLEYMTKNPTEELLWELQRRYETLMKKTISKRDKLVSDKGGSLSPTEMHMANFEAGISPEAYDAQGYLSLVTSMYSTGDNPAVKKFVEERDVNGISDRMKIVEEGRPIVDATSNTLDRTGLFSKEEIQKLREREDEAGQQHTERSKKIYEKQRR